MHRLEDPSHLAMLDRNLEVLLRRRRDGMIDDTMARRIQARLDIEVGSPLCR